MGRRNIPIAVNPDYLVYKQIHLLAFTRVCSGDIEQGRPMHNEAVIKRISFLYQAAHAVAMMGASTQLCRYYVKNMLKLSEKKLIRLDPTVKRTICYACNMLLLPAVTATVEEKVLNGRKAICVKCRLCSKECKFMVHNPNYSHVTDNFDVIGVS